MKLDRHEWITDILGMITLGGFFFIYGILGWALVRWIFNFIDKHEGKTIVEVIKKVKKTVNVASGRFFFIKSWYGGIEDLI